MKEAHSLMEGEAVNSTSTSRAGKKKKKAD